MANEPSLTSEEISRYRRHILLPEIGGSGQQRLKAARVLVIGAGGLGSPVLEYLAGAGVGTLTIMDDDVVSLSNLHRQLIHESGRVGELKTTSAAARIAAINPHVTVIAEERRLTAANASQIFAGKHVVIDGSDNFATRYLAADSAEAARVPLVTGAVGRFDGSLTVVKPYAQNAEGLFNPGYRDLFPHQPPEGMLPACAEAGIVGALTGVIGTMMAMEAIKLICGIGDTLVGRLLLYDALGASFETIRYRRRGPDQARPGSTRSGGR